jgi:hypothetical protein
MNRAPFCVGERYGLVVSTSALYSKGYELRFNGRQLLTLYSVSGWLWSIRGIILTGESRSRLGGKDPVPVPLRPPHITHGQVWDETRASPVRSQWPTTWAMAILKSLVVIVSSSNLKQVTTTSTSLQRLHSHSLSHTASPTSHHNTTSIPNFLFTYCKHQGEELCFILIYKF